MGTSRRRFIQLSSLASASFMVPGFLQSFAASPPVSGGSKKLIVLQLSGGNDGLNTVIPVRNDIYYRGRPAIGIKGADALKLTDELALNPSLAGFKGLYDSGALSIVNGVGYAKPNRSHFRSMDIWQSGSASEEIITTGWLGRYLDICPDCSAPDTRAIEVDDSLSLSMKGKFRNGLAIRDPVQFYNAAKAPYLTAIASGDHAAEHDNSLPAFLHKTLRETISSAEYVHTHFNAGKPTQSYPNTAIGKRMKVIATLILSDADTQVYYASHGSFDTHVGQRGRQDKLLKEVDEAVGAFVAEMKIAGLFGDIAIMSFSEFGRRVSENGSNGTDHGTAAPMFFISGALQKAGVYNALPDLADLDSGDLKYSVDFKQAYASVLQDWLKVDPTKVLGTKIEALTLL